MASKTVSEAADKTVKSAPKKGRYSVEVLKVIKEAQQQHGLRHGDFQRYRQYCARRIARIRKSLHFPQGTKHKVVPKKVTVECLKDERFLYLPLIDAERAWAYAMQLKAEANTEPRKRFHMMSRLHKAMQHAETFTALCESDRCDARTKLESQAYSSFMAASVHFESEQWKEAINLFTTAKTIYEKLAGAFVDEDRELYEQRCEEISPNIRYCAYNIGDESAISDLKAMRLKTATSDALTSRLDELIDKTREKQASTLSEFTWRGRTLPIRNEKVRLFLLSLQECESQLVSEASISQQISVYESLLKELIEAQQSLREELKEDPVFKSVLRGQSLEGRAPNTVYLYTYLAYLKQTSTVQRNLLMIKEAAKKPHKPQDLARLYDIIIQNLSEVPGLPGVGDDTALCEDVNTQVTGYKAFRCFYIAQSCVVAKRWKEALALCERVLEYAGEAKRAVTNNASKELQQLMSSLDGLLQELDGLKFSCHASSILDSHDTTPTPASQHTSQPLSERLEEYYADPSLTSRRPNLTKFPPDFEPVPCKPLFFDVALSLVEFPSLRDRLETTQQSGGLSGMVKGWLWGKK